MRPHWTTVPFSSPTNPQSTKKQSRTKLLNWLRRLNPKWKRTSLTRKNTITIIGFLASFQLACNIKSIHEEIAMEVLHIYVKKTHSNALFSRTCATVKSFPIAASVRNVDNRFYNHLRSNLEVGNYLLKKFAADQANAELDTSILGSMQPGNKSSHQCEDV